MDLNSFAQFTRREYRLWMTASVVFTLVFLAVLFYLSPLWKVALDYYHYYGDVQRLRGFIEAAGPWAPVLYILLMAANVFTPLSAIPVEILGGLVFGFTQGVLFAISGLLLGSAAAFWVARSFKEKFKSWIGPEKIKKFHRFMARHGTLAAFIIFLIPSAPKDFICFAMGLSRISFRFFLAMVFITRLPMVIILSLQGAQIDKGHYYLTITLGVFYGLLLWQLIKHREAVFEWLERWHEDLEPDAAGR